MHWRAFLVYNAVGGIVWAIFYGLLGYFAGRLFHDNFAQVEQIASTIGWVTGGSIVVVVLVVIVIVRMRIARSIQVHRAAGQD